MQQNEIKSTLAFPSNLLSVLIRLTASRFLNKEPGEKKNAKHPKCVLARLKKDLYIKLFFNKMD